LPVSDRDRALSSKPLADGLDCRGEGA